MPIAVAAAALFFGLCLGDGLSRLEAGILVLALIGYMAMTVWIARSEQTAVAEEFAEIQKRRFKGTFFVQLAMVIAGLVALGYGADLFLEGAVNIALSLGVSEAMIGLTLVALGTSFPELAACVIAALRKHADICLGNVVGSCIYNVLAIGGISGLVFPLPVGPGFVGGPSTGDGGGDGFVVDFRHERFAAFAARGRDAVGLLRLIYGLVAVGSFCAGRA